MSSMFSLEGKNAAIVGAASGIGGWTAIDGRFTPPGM